MAFLSWLETTAYAQWIQAGLLGWPSMLSAHAIGLAIVVGIVLVLSLRLLGFFKPIPLTDMRGLLTFAWLGVIINIISGLSLFVAQGTFYVTNIPFLVKITFIALGIANLHYMQKVLKREASNWQAIGTVPQNGRLLGITAIAFWAMAVVTGRLIAYL